MSDAPSSIRFTGQARLVIAAALFVFGVSYGLMLSGTTQEADTHSVDFFRTAGELPNTKTPHLIRDVTALGGWVFLSLLTVGVGTALATVGERRAAKHLALTMVGGVLLTYALKWGIGRERPQYAIHIASKAFPSGHALMSTAFYLTLATVLRRITKRRRLHRLLLVCAVLLPALIGFSRVYLGVHYPTDVVAGWALGVAWATLSRSLFGERELSASNHDH